MSAERNSSNNASPRLISIRAACEKLGGVCVRTVERKHDKDVNFPRFVKVGRLNFINERELDSYINNLPRKNRL